MTGNLDAILTCVGMGSAEDGDEHFVNGDGMFWHSVILNGRIRGRHRGRNRRSHTGRIHGRRSRRTHGGNDDMPVMDGVGLGSREVFREDA